MALTYTLIASNTLTTSAASVTFSAIPNTYTDLVLRMSVRSNNASYATNTGYRFNGTTTNYSARYILGTGNTAVSGVLTTLNIGGSNFGRLDDSGTTAGTATSSTFNNNEMYIPNYNSSNNKCWGYSFAVENNSTTDNTLGATAGLWSNTAAITSISIAPSAGSFVSGSSFWLYGISSTV